MTTCLGAGRIQDLFAKVFDIVSLFVDGMDTTRGLFDINEGFLHRI
jgi:hypothetical protein